MNRPPVRVSKNYVVRRGISVNGETDIPSPMVPPGTEYVTLAIVNKQGDAVGHLTVYGDDGLKWAKRQGIGGLD
jgi:hypothetical protein